MMREGVESKAVSRRRWLSVSGGGASAAPRLLLTLAFTEGAAVMVAELVGARMLAPQYGNSLYVWGAIIGVTLISLTLGYYLGGLLSYRRRRTELVYWFLLVAAFLIALMPTLAHTLMVALDGMGAVRAILLATSLYLLPPLLLLGATTPLIISILSRDVADAGGVTGMVYATSTVGGILGTFAAGFYLIPDFGLTRTAVAAGIVLAILPFVLLLRLRHYPALLYPLALVLLLMPGAADKPHPGVRVLYQSEGLLGQLKVVDVSYTTPDGRSHKNDRILFVNRAGQTWVNLDTGQAVWEYVHYLKTIGSVLPPGARVLLLGLGGGMTARNMQAIGHSVDSVELDERVPDIARRYFGLAGDSKVIVDDGRHYLRNTRERYDLIIFDVYQAEIPPAHMLTLETFRELQQRLNPGGFVVISYTGFLTGPTGYGARSIYKTLLAAGYEVSLVPTGANEDTRNNIYIATLGAVDFTRPRAPLVIGGQVRSLPELFIDPALLDLEQAMVLRDNQPILEKLNLEAAAIWRASYHRIFTRPFLEMGIPLFE
ncbi:MAG: fused MFS/spermidine synthase [Gammaproteobacteria bacterium]|nr:fused MFS/spermidine synthase [Gammaproteobacteria bacterium]